MKTIKELNIKDWSGYFFKNMTNINDVDPESFIVMTFKIIKMDRYCLTQVIVKKIVCLMLFLIIWNVFLEKVVFSVI